MVGIAGLMAQASRDDVGDGAVGIARHVLRQKGGTQARLTDDLARVGLDGAGNDFEQGGLALAVTSCDAGAVAGFDTEADFVQYGGAAVTDTDIAKR